MTRNWILLSLLLVTYLSELGEASRSLPVCKCKDKDFACGTDSGSKCSCIPSSWKCDGDYDCEDFSDERDCESPGCLPDWFECQNGKCIKDNWKCDGEDDCDDDSDEQDCGPETCNEDDKTCDSGECVLSRWWCDGEADCDDGSDEKSCPKEPCKEEEFACADGGCVDAGATCDEVFDCRDGSDEEEDACSPVDERITGNLTCKDDEFFCENGGDEDRFYGEELDSCIPFSYLCDGEKDCDSGVDEENCTRPCSGEEYRCGNGQCIDLLDHCDGYSDCGDGSDELDCPEHEACLDGEFRCETGLCISLNWRCDGDDDCPDGSDEEGCSDGQACERGQFQCVVSRRCIQGSWTCDGQIDCDDGSDERHCQCKGGEYLCASGQCIAMGKLCNGVVDCIDGSDERPVHSCNNSLVLGSNATSCADNNGGCEHTCRETSSGGRMECVCAKGFHLASDMRSCIDVDECDVDGFCSQTCNNTVGGFACSCLSGYFLRADQRSCKASGPAPALLFTNRIDIKRMNPDLSDPKPILRDLENAIGLDYHIEKGLVFWSDVTLDRIMRSNLNGSRIQGVVSSGLESPGGVAVDWIHDLLYWTDSRTSRIEVALLDGSNRKVIVWERLQKPRALALHPIKSLMFWTDWGGAPCLESAAMDGSMRRSIASRNVHWPNGLTIDYTNNHIYWSDAKYHIIEVANLDGGQRRAVVSRGLPHPFGITIFEDKVYWTDWQTKSVNSANKFTGSGVKMIERQLHFPMCIRTFHPLRQPAGENKCLHANCSHLCLPRPDGYACACPTGFRIVNMTHCAENIENFLVFTRKNDIRRISFDGIERADIVLPLGELKNAVALDWHSGHPGYIYWSDIGLDTISRSNWDGSNQKMLFSSSLDSPAGIAIDWITDKIYWADSGINRIEVAMLDGSMRCVLVWTGLDRPRAIIVHPKTGHMFWTDWGRDPKIERAGMDGSNRTTIVSVGLRWPNGIAMDYANQRIYWADAGEHIIESCDLNGNGRRVIVNGDLPHPFGITMDETKIYWTDWNSKSINFADKFTGANRGVLRKELPYLMDIRYYNNARPLSPNPCSVRNGECSHLCLLAPNPSNQTDRFNTSYSCACPTGLTLESDDRNCNTKMNKFLAIARRSDIRVISLDVPYSADVKLNIDAYMTNVVDVAVDSTEGHLFWSDIGSRTISRSTLSEHHGTEEAVIGSGLDTVDGLAVDVTGRLLYWTDDGRDTLSVSTLDGKYRRVLISKNMDSPRAIALHYAIGYMYWTDWGNNPTAKIERAGMDGSDRSVIVSKGLVWPNGITIEHEMGWIIWGDAQNEKIERANLLGKDRQTIYRPTPHPYSLACMGGFLYWTDWQTRNIQRLNLRNLTDVKVIRENMPSMMGIKAVTMGESEMNRCGENNGGCSHLCLRSPTSDLGFTCACTTGIRMQQDGRTCSNLPREYLLFTTRRSIRRVSLEADLSSFVDLPVGDLENAIALDYHFGRQLLFFTDVYLDVILRSNLDGSDVKTIVSKNLKTMDGLAVDWVANNLYWTDAGPNTISVARLDGGNRKIVVSGGLDEPRALSVHPSQGIMFWTDWGGKARIEKAYLDGTGRKVLIRKNLQWPNGLTVDYANARIFWVDAHHLLNRIESCDFNGRRREAVLSPVPHGFAITYLHKTLYWTDWQTKNIHSISLPVKRSKRKNVIKGIEGLMGIKAVSSSRQIGTNACDDTTGYGGCNHLCLMRGPRKYVCACADEGLAEEDENLENIKATSSSIERNCSIVPVPSKLNLIKTTTSTTKAIARTQTVVATTLSTTETIVTEPVTRTDLPHIISIIAGFLAVFFIVLICGGLCCFLRKDLKKLIRSNVREGRDTVTYRNPTYGANSNSTSGSVARLTPSSSIRGNADLRSEKKAPLLRSPSTSRPECPILITEEDASERVEEPGPLYSGMATLEASIENAEDSADEDRSACELPLLQDSGCLETAEPQNRRPTSAHEYAAIPIACDDNYKEMSDYSLASLDVEVEQRFSRRLADGQLASSIATTSSILLSEDSTSLAKSSEDLKVVGDVISVTAPV